MRKNILGKILITLGVYLLVINPIMSILFNTVGPIGYNVPISIEDYWRIWLTNYGV